MKIIHNHKFRQQKQAFHQTLDAHNVSWGNTFSHLLFYLGQIAKDFIYVIIAYFVIHEFTSYMVFSQQAGLQYVRQNLLMIKFMTMLGAVLGGIVISWAAWMIIHTTFSYPKFICRQTDKERHHDAVLKRAQALEAKKLEAHASFKSKFKKTRAHKRAQRKLKRITKTSKRKDRKSKQK